MSFLTTFKGKVDPERDGLLSICASSEYTSYAAQTDSRIKALATVSAAYTGRMIPNGGLHEENNKEDPRTIAAALQAAAQWCTAAVDVSLSTLRIFKQ